MAAEFQVVPDDVDKFGGALRDLAGQAGAAVSHTTKWFELQDGSTGIYVKVKEIVEQLQKNLEANYTHLQTLSNDSAAELGKAAQLYRTTDHESAQRLDETYPGAAR
ncbi:type VII secretion target [Nocardia sp. NPDC052254]|uniref:type VII secretion target n=1 Tax=Nocardia sp. NPDC052254 TaxID=3155681 RepID=UPI003448DC2E